MKFCPNCGTQLPDSSKFCIKCGFKQEVIASETSGQQPVYAPSVQPPVYEPPVYQPPVEEAHVHEVPVQPPAYEAPVETRSVYEAPVEEPAYTSELHTYGAPVQHNFSAPVRTVGQNEGTYTIPAPEEPVAAGKPRKAPKAPKAHKEPKAAGEKKPVNKKLFLFAGIGLAAVVIAVLLISLLGGGADADDPNLGVYTAVSCIVDGEELKAKEFEDDYIELKTKGKATVSILGDEFGAKWSLDGKDFVLTFDGDEYEGTLKKGKLKINFDDMEYVFEKSEETEDEEENAQEDKDGEEEKPEIPVEVGCWVLLRSESEDEGLVVDEETVQLLESMGMHSFVEFYEDGSGFISVMGEETFDFTWDNGTLSANDGQLEYTFEGEELRIDFNGMVLVFVRGEKPQVEDAHPETPAEPESPAEPETPAQPETPAEPESSGNPYDWWGGDWYGWWAVWNGYGMLAEYTDTFWDAYAHIDVSGESGTVVLWDVDGSTTDPLAVVDVSFRQGLNPCGTMVSEGGMFMDAPIDHANWNADPGASTTRIYENMITIEGEYTHPTDPETTMEYIIILRPWGMEWEDVRNGDNSGQYYDDMMPAYYDDWYIPLVEMGADMPDSYQEGVDIISGGAPATPAAPAAANALASGSWDGCTVAIVGAEAFKDADGADAVRVYYDYTNTSDETTYAAGEVYCSFIQDGVELESTYASYEDEVAEDDNDYLNVRPGVTIRCVAEYSMNLDGGPVVVSLSNYWNEAENATVELQPQNMPGGPASPLRVVPIADPQWLSGWPSEGECDTAYVSIDKAEIVDSYDGQKLLRVYYTYTNNGAEASSLWLDAYIYAYQDGVELNTGIAANVVPEDSNYYNNVEPGKSATVSICYVLNGSSPVEVEITDGWNDGGVGRVYTVE